MSQIGVNIKKLRKVKGMSQQAFADLFELTRGNISSYEEFRAEPKIEVILRIAKYFSIPVAELLEQQLTVNEILNFEDHFDATAALVNNKDLFAIPFLKSESLLKRGSDIFQELKELPQIFLPVYSRHCIVAVENALEIPRPSVFPFEEGAILFFEQIELDSLHTLDSHFGFYACGEEFFFGQFAVQEKTIELQLSSWKKAVFSLENISNFWKVYGKFEKIS